MITPVSDVENLFAVVGTILPQCCVCNAGS